MYTRMYTYMHECGTRALTQARGVQSKLKGDMQVKINQLREGIKNAQNTREGIQTQQANRIKELGKIWQLANNTLTDKISLPGPQVCMRVCICFTKKGCSCARM